MPPAATLAPADLPSRRKYLIFGVMAFGQFMALTDIQIVAASVNSVQAGLSAGPDEISWVQTGYLMAELVMIPFAAFLAQALSTRWLFALSAGLFTIASMACGLAWDIESMIAFRAIQGFVGGAMVPTVFATGFVLFEGKQRAMIAGILGMVSVLAPTLGPTLGGLISDTLGWRWLFYINLVPGIVVTVLAILLIRVDCPNLPMLARIDYAHLLSMAAFLAGLQYVLEEGPRREWFGDHRIQIAAWLSAVGLALFLERSFRSRGPVVKLTPFARPTFAISCAFNLTIGFGLYASTYLIPIYLGRVRGFSSLDIGTTVWVTGIAQIVSTLIAARASQVVDQRIVITFGLALFALSLWWISHMTAEWGFYELLGPQLLRGFAVMLCIVPSVSLALTGFEGPELRYAAGLFNLMRNLGGAIGIATVNTWLQDDARLHALRFGEALGARGSNGFVSGLAAEIGRTTTDSARALLMAQAELARLVGREALTLAFNDVFRAMAIMFLAALVLVPFCRSPKPDPG